MLTCAINNWVQMMAKLPNMKSETSFHQVSNIVANDRHTTPDDQFCTKILPIQFSTYESSDRVLHIILPIEFSRYDFSRIEFPVTPALGTLRF